MRKLRLPRFRVTPSLVISMLALFVALSGTGVAAQIVPLAKRALNADKAKTANTAKIANTAKVANDARKLNGQTATEIAAVPGPATDAQTLTGLTAAQIAATPGPASSIPSAAFRLVSRGWSVQNQGDVTTERALCAANEKAVGGGWDQASGLADVRIDKPLPELTGWEFQIFALSGNHVPANGSVWVVCMRTS